MWTLYKFVTQATVVLALANLPLSCWSLCTYRSYSDLHPTAFSYWASWGCYLYNRPDLFEEAPLKVDSGEFVVDGNKYFIPGLIFRSQFVKFHYSEEKIEAAVKRTFKDRSNVDKWIQCTKDAENCCSTIMNQSETQANHCAPVWDGWSCFKTIPGGETYEQVCSKYAYGGQVPRCNHYSHKECFGNGTWRQDTDYASCDITPELKFRTNWHIGMLALSIIFAAPAALALIVLNTQKLCIIRNLVFTLILRNFFLILVKSVIILDEILNIESTVMAQNLWPCKFLTFLEKLSGNLVFACMLLEGIYLHQLLTKVFRTRQKGGVPMTRFYIGTLTLAVGSAITWMSVMVSYFDANCWQVTEGTDYSWILSGPRLVMLVINIVLLLHIVWVLWSTFHSKENDHHAAKRTVKAALICLPLFGVPYLFVIVHPDTDSCSLEQFYFIVDYSIEPLQTIFIVIFHCYRERDVKGVFKAVFRKFTDYWDRSVRKHDSFSESIADRRATMRSDLENTENRIPTAGNGLTQQPPEGIVTQELFSPVVDVPALPCKASSPEGSDSSNQINLSMHNTTSFNNCNVNIDPRMLFRDRFDDIVLLDPNERKH